MKKSRYIGILALALAGIVLLTGVFSQLLRLEKGPFSGLMASAKEARQAVTDAQDAVKQTETALRKADIALADAKAAAKEADEATALASADEASHSTLYERAESAVASMEGVEKALDGAAGSPIRQAVDGAKVAVSDVSDAVGEIEYAAMRDILSTAEKGVEKASASYGEAYEALSHGAPTAQPPAEYALDAQQDTVPLLQVRLEAEALAAHAQWLIAQATQLSGDAKTALTAVTAAQQGLTIGTVDRLVHWLSTYTIAVLFTGFLLLAIGIVLFFFAAPFVRAWKRSPVFSTFIALFALMILQIYAMKFTYATGFEWGKAWLDNVFNVLRANTSVGIIALGMTLIIITGGIDLAVGSTLSGVGTVVMVLLDTSPRGILGSLGITGIAAYIIGIAVGFLVGALIGALIGLVVTKGRMPPFIVTLGVMNIVRSLAQFFTKSYAPKMPSDFTAISNTVIFGQRLLPIVYWLVLSFLFHILTKRTPFGRYVYAVGSNERTTRLSGINVDRVKFMVYTLMGLLVSFASITQLSRLGGMDVFSAGSGYELDAIAAVVVGGTSMSGGRGSILGTVIGVLIIGVMNNLLILLGVDSFLTSAFKGAIVIASVLMQRKERMA